MNGNDNDSPLPSGSPERRASLSSAQAPSVELHDPALRALFDPEKIAPIAKTLPATRDLTNPQHNAAILAAADRMVDVLKDSAAALALEDFSFVEYASEFTAVFKLCVKLARARLFMLGPALRDTPLHLTVVVAIYGETVRMYPSSEKKNGENFIVVKCEELRWLTAGTQTTWRLVLVDDGCPDGSGHEAKKIIEREGLGDRVEVLFLEDGLEEMKLQSTKDSRKGGSVQYGLRHAIADFEAKKKDGRDDVVGRQHVVAYSDADLSSHLSQLGLLLQHVVAHEKVAACGNRYGARGVIESGSGGSEDGSGLLDDRVWCFVLLRDWLRRKIMPPIGHVLDSQCGLKLFRVEYLPTVLERMTDLSFTFDVELMLLLASTLYSSEKRPFNDTLSFDSVVWIDSVEEATSRGSDTHLSHLKRLVELHKLYADEMKEYLTADVPRIVEWIETLTLERYMPVVMGFRKEFGETAGFGAEYDFDKILALSEKMEGKEE